ncbi:cysteine desulfurase family protein [Novosphingobium cyanobacteriorum]|uniref:Cysteine desulfurase n=1 Tax=Novosphingobium cyanobacteriorum TaxID=3024215 RepID=A0ABT6CJR9_9SPHN|nr:aminotransferase class V-fold PLP-dependent enzyme [Novosphingobium cyanobacteriorum]MDF8334169.1 aminotransferase class V-fold PLP-dependent enzyme [Novosphingobium cyanobacteriorum]
MPIYLDHAATTPILPQALAAMEEGLRIWANPSSPHKAGRAARAALEDARARVKAVLGWQGEVVFTSGASEALALAVGRSAKPLQAVSVVEHEAILRLSAEAPRWPVDTLGRVVPAPASGLIAVQQVNNETGVIQPLDQLAADVRAAGGWLLADCAQGAGKLALPDADLIAISAHKFGGPIGIGALLVRDWAMLRPTGGQERGYRPGTENLPGALAMATALEAGHAWLEEADRLRQKLDACIEVAGGSVIARNATRLPTIGAYRMPGKSANAQLIRFDGLGFAVSAGSACSSGSLKASHVLTAMAVEGAGEVIRVSIGRETTEAEIDAFLAAWREIAG